MPGSLETSTDERQDLSKSTFTCSCSVFYGVFCAIDLPFSSLSVASLDRGDGEFQSQYVAATADTVVRSSMYCIQNMLVYALQIMYNSTTARVVNNVYGTAGGAKSYCHGRMCFEKKFRAWPMTISQHFHVPPVLKLTCSINR